MVTKAVHKQIRGFVFIWLAITFLMWMVTFFAIYFTYNPEELNIGAGNPLSLASAVQSDETAEVLLCFRAPRHSLRLRLHQYRPAQRCRSILKKSPSRRSRRRRLPRHQFQHRSQ